MKYGINNRQMVFIILLTLTAVTIIGLPRTMAETAGYGSWFTLILASVGFGLAALMIVSLNGIFSGEVLFDYSAKLVGRFGSVALGVFYMLYFLTISAYLCANMTNILVSNFFLHTPPWFVVLVSIPFYGYSAYKGVISVARLSEVIGSIFLIVTLSSFVMMIIQGKVDHVRPFFVAEDVMKYVKAVKGTVTSFLGVEILTLFPLSEKSRKRAPLVAFLAVIGVGLFFVLNVESTIMMNGMNEVKNENNALISAIRQIQIPALSFFERMDLLYLTIGFSGLFAAKTIVMLAATEYACKVFSKVKRIYVVLAVMTAVLASDLYFFSLGHFGDFFEPFCLTAGLFAAFGIPGILLIIAKVKGYGAKTQEKDQEKTQ